MKTLKIKAKYNNFNHSVIIGDEILHLLPRNIKSICPKTKKIAIVYDKNIPNKKLRLIKKILKNYHLLFIKFNSSEKSKSFKVVNSLVEKLLINKFNRSDLLIGLGGGIVGDVSAFIACITKRGINFINIPTTLLAQVDSSIGGKTGVNSTNGKNLIGAFFQPSLVLIDTSFLKTLPKREMICGYAEILKHSLIKDLKFFNWLKLNTKKIINKDSKALIYSIYKSCKIKLSFVQQDTKEKGHRMKLNFGHTFAHALEACSNYSKQINHGEAVLIGMMVATKLSYYKKICNKNSFDEIVKIYEENNLINNTKKLFKVRELSKILKYMQNDKKNDSEKINLILLKKVGKTTNPGNFKMSISEIKKILLTLSNINF